MDKASSTKRKEKLNKLDGKTWSKYSISIWNMTKNKKEMKLKHPAMFPSELCRRLIDIYTKEGDTILDPFMGSGSTIVAAKELGRKGIGFDINPDFIKLTKVRLSQENLINNMPIKPEIFCENATNIHNFVKPDSVDLVITSPPYWNIHTRKRTADYKESRPYSALDGDIGNIPDYNKFMEQLKAIFKEVYLVLKPGKKCVIIVMDIRVESKFYPFHMDICDMMKTIGFVLDDIIIWDRRKEYSNLRPLGYPYVFIVNKIHEYILIFRKNKNEGKMG